MTKIEKITNIITSLALFYEKRWSTVKVEKIVDTFANSKLKEIEKAIERVKQTEEELGTNPIPQIKDKYWVLETEFPEYDSYNTSTDANKKPQYDEIASVKEVKKLKEYETAYEYVLSYWDNFDKEQQKQINKDLNEIFILNKEEQIEKE